MATFRECHFSGLVIAACLRDTQGSWVYVTFECIAAK